jgi:transposase
MIRDNDCRVSQILDPAPFDSLLATTILLETGPIERFAAAGNFASYARRVDSVRASNGKKKGEGNTKNENKYLAWAFVEAANFALRYCPRRNGSTNVRRRRRTTWWRSRRWRANWLGRASTF